MGQCGQVSQHTAEAVIEGYGDADPIGRGVSERLANEESVVENVVVRKGCAFRRTGCPRRVLNVDWIVELQSRLAGIQLRLADLVPSPNKLRPSHPTGFGIRSQIDHMP